MYSISVDSVLFLNSVSFLNIVPFLNTSVTLFLSNSAFPYFRYDINFQNFQNSF